MGSRDLPRHGPRLRGEDDTVNDAPWIDRRVREGRSQGEGSAYRPWLRTTEVRSRGLSCRTLGWTTGRVHHLLSRLERRFFCILEWSDRVIDIREQYALLPRTATVELARAAGIRHPRYPRGPRQGEACVMTTDFLITLAMPPSAGAGPALVARAIKPRRELQKPRVAEKLRLEHLYWQWRGIDWAVVTEDAIPEQLADNVWFLRPYRDIGRRLPLPAHQHYDVARRLTDLVRGRAQPLRLAAAECDRLTKLPSGSSLAVAYHLLATKQWTVDLSHRLQPGEVLPLLGVDLIPPSRA